MNPADKIYPDLEAICPCGRKFYVDTLQFAVLHELPVCERFESLEPHEFLRYVRQSKGITDN